MNILFDLLVAYLPFVGFAPLSLNTMIKLVNFEELWKLKDDGIWEYLVHNILCSHITFNYLQGYGRLEFEARCLRVYAMQYYCMPKTTY